MRWIKGQSWIVNDVNYESLKWLNKAGFTSQIKSTIKNVNYQAKNAVGYNNDDFRSEYMEQSVILVRYHYLKIKTIF